MSKANRKAVIGITGFIAALVLTVALRLIYYRITGIETDGPFDPLGFVFGFGTWIPMLFVLRRIFRRMDGTK